MVVKPVTLREPVSQDTDAEAGGVHPVRATFISGFLMSPIDEKHILDPNVTWQSKVLAWALQQGLAVVLLVGILVGVWHKSPALLDQIQNGYRQNQEQLSGSVEVLAEKVDLIVTHWEAEREAMKEQHEKDLEIILLLIKSHPDPKVAVEAIESVKTK